MFKYCIILCMVMHNLIKCANTPRRRHVRIVYTCSLLMFWFILCNIIKWIVESLLSFLILRRRARKSELLSKQKATKKASSSRYGENIMVERCPECNAVLEQYDEDTIGYCVIVLATFIHREPALATPLLLETLQCVSRWSLMSHNKAWLELNLLWNH